MRDQHLPVVSSGVDRRSFMKGVVLLGAATAAGSALAACGASSSSGAPSSAAPAGSGAAPSGAASAGASAAATGSVRFGVNANAAVPTAGYDAVFAEFTARTGIEVVPNKLLYTEQINNYLTQAPDDVLIWLAGYRMRFFADQGLVSDVSGIWESIGTNASDGVKQACTAADGKQYLVPFYNYPWVVFYRKSVFADGGYTVPTTLAELTALGDRMKSDGLAPIAFSDKEGWESMGTFDIINMRTNGYDFHISLMAGKESWIDPRVKQTFATWTQLLPYHQENALGRTWQEASQSLNQKKSGMYLMGSFISAQFPGADFEDLDFFPFPALNAEHGQDAIDAPIDGFMMVKEPDNRPAAEELLRFLSTGAAQDLYLETDPNSVGTAKDVDANAYTALQKKYAEIIASTPNIAQYLDRDTRPDFATTAVLPSFQSYLRDPGKIDSILDSLQKQATSIFAS